MSEKNNFLKHFTIIGGGTLINMLLGVFTTPVITRLVDPVEYGQLSIFTMYSGIALMVLCMGLDQALVRYYYERTDEKYKRALLFKCIKLPLLVSVILSIIVILISASGAVKLEFDTYIIVLLCVYTVVQLIYRFSLLLVRLAYKSKLYSALNITHKLTYIVFALPLVMFFCEDDLLSLVIATLASGLVCMIVSMAAQSSMWNITKYKVSECTVSSKELIKYGYPYIFSMGVTTLFQAMDKMSLNMYCSYSEVGIYSSTMTLINVFAIIQTTFNSLWAPMSVEHYSKDKKDKSFYQKGNQIITVVMFFVGLSLILCKDLFAILLGEKYREAAYILPFLIFNPIMYTVSETTVCGLVFMKKSKMQVVVAVGACVTNIIGNTLLVPSLGCQGAAISTGISYIVFFTLRTVLSNRYFYVDYKLKKFYALTFVTCLYAFYNTFNRFNAGSIISYVLCLAILILLYKDTIVWCIKYAMDIIKKFLKKRKSRE